MEHFLLSVVIFLWLCCSVQPISSCYQQFYQFSTWFDPKNIYHSDGNVNLDTPEEMPLLSFGYFISSVPASVPWMDAFGPFSSRDLTDSWWRSSFSPKSTETGLNVLLGGQFWVISSHGRKHVFIHSSLWADLIWSSALQTTGLSWIHFKRRPINCCAGVGILSFSVRYFYKSPRKLHLLWLFALLRA